MTKSKTTKGVPTITMTLTGQAGLLMHSSRGANPLDPLAKQVHAISKRRTKTDDDWKELSRLEWECGMYHDHTLGPYIPGGNLKRFLEQGGAKVKKGTAIKAGVFVLQDRIPLDFPGRKAGMLSVDALWDTGKYVDTRPCKLGGKQTVMRTRPFFAEWSLTFQVSYDETVVDADDIIRAAQTAGRVIGLGDYHPLYGRCEVTIEE